MYASQLLRLSNTDRFVKSTLKGVFANNTLPKISHQLQPKAFIVNSASSHSAGDHWLLIFVKPTEKQVIFFDSFGKSPKCYSSTLHKWIMSWGYNVCLNIKTLQASHSNYCGLFVLFVLYYLSRNVPLNVILKKFSSNQTRNDVLVNRFAWCRFRFNGKKEIKQARTKEELHNKIKLDLYLIASQDYL